MTKHEYCKQQIRECKVWCNCGGLQYKTDHAPDCEIMLAWDNFAADYDQIIYEQEYARIHGEI